MNGFTFDMILNFFTLLNSEFQKSLCAAILDEFQFAMRCRGSKKPAKKPLKNGDLATPDFATPVLESGMSATHRQLTASGGAKIKPANCHATPASTTQPYAYSYHSVPSFTTTKF